MNETRRCGDCRYFDAGRCRFTSPTPTGWPATTAADWCGEWTSLRTANQSGEHGVPPGLLREVNSAAAPVNKSQRRLI